MLGSGPGRGGLIQPMPNGVANYYPAFGPLPPGTVVKALRVCCAAFPGAFANERYTLQARAVGDVSADLLGQASDEYNTGRPLTPSIPGASLDAGLVYDIPLDFVATEVERNIVVYFSNLGNEYLGFFALVLGSDE